MAIIIQNDGEDLEWLQPKTFKKEINLQEYVADNPSVIPLRELDEGLRLMTVGKEFPTSNGPIDILALDHNGQIYIIETKLDFNHDKRKVAAQVMDYAAALWRDFGSNGDDFVEAINKYYQMDLLEEYASFFKGGEFSDIVDNLAESLRTGSFKLIVLMDKVDQKLKDLILFINSNSQFSIYAVELQYYRKGKMAVIVPGLYGAEVQKRTRGKPNKFVDSTADNFFSAAEANKAMEFDSMRYLDGVIRSSIRDGAEFLYMKNPAGKEVAYIKTSEKRYPLLLYAAGKLTLHCKSNSPYHQANRILLKKLSEEKLFIKEGLDLNNLSFKQLDLNGSSRQEIERLGKYYLQSFQGV